MSYFYGRFIIAWVCWLIWADKSRWKEIIPVCLLASLLSLVSDVIVEWYIPYWRYYGSEPTVSRKLLDSFDVYIVVTYLFIQWLPKKQSFLKMFSYWFLWTGFAAIIEFFQIKTGHMAHFQGWSLLHSYIFDWILLWIFYQYHKIFCFKKLSR